MTSAWRNRNDCSSGSRITTSVAALLLGGSPGTCGGAMIEIQPASSPWPSCLWVASASSAASDVDAQIVHAPAIQAVRYRPDDQPLDGGDQRFHRAHGGEGVQDGV